MTWPPHPDDEWVEVMRLGSPTSQYVLGLSGAQRAIAQAKERYAQGHLTLSEFEQVVERVLNPMVMSTFLG